MKDKKVIVVAFILLGFYVSAQGIPGPLLAVIAKNLRVTSKSTLSLMLTLPSLFMIPTMLLTGAFAARMSKKTLIYVASVVYLIGAFGPIFTNNIGWILTCRAILGLGCGILFPLPYAMIPEYFEGPSRHTMMGIMTAASSIWAATCAVLSGILGSVTWQHAFYIYSFGFVPLLFVFFFLPAIRKAEPASVATGEKKKSGAPAPITYFYGLVMLVFFANIQIVGNLIAFFVDSEGLGTARTVGGTNAVKTAASFAAGLCFGPLFGFFKKWGAFAGVAAPAVGYLLMSIAPSLPILIIAGVFIGAGMGFITPLIMTWSTKNSPNAVSLSLAITQIGMMLGLFTSSLFLKLFAMLGSSAPRTTFLYSGVMLSTMAVVFLVVAMTRSEEKVPVLREEELVAN